MPHPEADAPVIQDVSPFPLVVAGGLLSFEIEVYDPNEDDELSLACSNTPVGASLERIQARTWRFDWPTATSDAGSISLQFIASDGAHDSAKKTYAVTVLPYSPPDESANLLANGGFEYGGLGFHFWVAADDSSCYDVFASPDSHGGAFSLEIRPMNAAAGAGGAKSYVYTSVETEPNVNYTLTFWAKCSGSAFIATDNVQRIDGGSELEENGEWTRKTITFRSTEGYDKFFLYFGNSSDRSLYIDDAVLQYTDTPTPDHSPVYGGGHAAVVVDGRTIRVDGEPFLGLGFWGLPYDKLGEAAEMGVNVAVVSSGLFHPAKGNYFDRAYESGIYTIPDSTMTAWMDEPALFSSTILRYADHPSVMAWQLADEPDFVAQAAYGSITPEIFTKQYDQIKNVADLPVVADFQTAWNKWDIDFLSRYAAGVDVWGGEPYNGLMGAQGLNEVWLRLETFGMIEAAKGTGERPIMLNLNPVQEGGSDLVDNLPKAYYSLIRGARTLLFFTWEDFDKYPQAMATARQIMTEFRSLEEVIFGDDVTQDVAATGMSSDSRMMARRYGDSIYVFLVTWPSSDSPSQAQTVSFSHPDFSHSSKVDVLFEGGTLTSDGASFEDTISGVARRVYRIKVAD